MHLHYALVVLLQIAVSTAAVIQGSLTGIRDIDADTSVIRLRSLDSGLDRFVYLTSDGEFALTGVTPGTYELGLQSATIEAPHRYTVTVNDDHVVEVRKLRGLTVPHPVAIAWRRSELVVDRPAFSLWQMIKSPTVFLSVSSLVMIWALPWLIGNLDEETLSELRTRDESRNKKASETMRGVDVAKIIADKRHKATS